MVPCNGTERILLRTEGVARSCNEVQALGVFSTGLIQVV